MIAIGNYVGWKRPRTSQAFEYLFDVQPGAFAAYSINRVLNPSYTGPLIRVVDSSLNEQDISAVNGSLNTSQLLAFAGSDTVTIKTVYEQSGSGEPNLQQTAKASQPFIVNNGNLVTYNGKPCADFDGVSKFLTTGSMLFTAPTISFSIVSKHDQYRNETMVRSRPLGAYGTLKGISYYEAGTAGSFSNTFNDDGLGNAIGYANGAEPSTITLQHQNMIGIVSRTEIFNHRLNIETNNTAFSEGNTQLSGGALQVDPVVNETFVGQSGGNNRYFDGKFNELVMFESGVNAISIQNNIKGYYQ